MGEIIEVQFGATPSGPEKDKESDEVIVPMPQDFDEKLEPDVIKAIVKSLAIVSYLKALSGIITSEARTTAQEAVKNYTPTEMALMINDSSEFDWKSKPALFQALVYSLHKVIKG